VRLHDDERLDHDFLRSLPKPQPPPQLVPLSQERLTAAAAAVFDSRPKIKLTATVAQDKATDAAALAFEVSFNGSESFEEPRLPSPGDGWGIGLLVGPSGSGKSTVIRRVVQVRSPFSHTSPIDLPYISRL
jgi:hypothetical protein